MRNGMLVLTAIALLAVMVAPLQAAVPGMLADLILPEPASLGLLALGGVALLLRRKR